ncbi:Putative DNA repair helicase RadD [Cupriavidus yeoncheonensis]|uniref:DNA repair helicase RadD n=1 Tax=Cupriavidus yeoncheonensis TaxID=1462994 RepID=A0A916IVZ7_9BURK|nr:DEAD/DEAH box helicase [Cupriavidus yeoncheonensis]CAG2144569.1 Putative DNA repair helicase RadD [Cupriavidus yeoncheonensis]
MIVLRDYQNDLVARAGQALRRVRRVLIVLPPGGGKTVIAAFIAQAFANRGQQTFFNCHRAELLKQTSGTFTDCGLAHGFIAAGHPMYVNASVQVCSIDTLKNRVLKLAEPRVVIWDECHHIGAAGWAAIMAAWPNAFHIGLTGTPWRLDGTGLGAYFDEMVLGPTAAELIEMGNLAPYRIYAPSAPDMKGVRKQMGDFAQKDAAERMREPKLTGDIITHWRKYADGMRTVGYAVNVSHSQYLAELFNAAGIPAAHLDGGTDNGERKRVIQAYADGAVRVLFNVGLFGEGFDLSAWAGRPVTIDAAILANPTMSLSKYLQESMRCMRPAPGKTGVILDHAGNSNRHGFPDDEREWDLEGNGGKRKGDSDNGPPPPVTCEKCFVQIRRPTPPCCPSCGKRLQAEAKPVEVAEGNLMEVTEAEKRATRMRLKQEQAACKDLGSLVALFAQRGSKNPQYQAMKVMQARGGKHIRSAQSVQSV